VTAVLRARINVTTELNVKRFIQVLLGILVVDMDVNDVLTASLTVRGKR